MTFYSIHIWEQHDFFGFHAHTRTYMTEISLLKKFFVFDFSLSALLKIFLLLSKKSSFVGKRVICTKHLRLDLTPPGCNMFQAFSNVHLDLFYCFIFGLHFNQTKKQLSETSLFRLTAKVYFSTLIFWYTLILFLIPQ